MCTVPSSSRPPAHQSTELSNWTQKVLLQRQIANTPNPHIKSSLCLLACTTGQLASLHSNTQHTALTTLVCPAKTPDHSWACGCACGMHTNPSILVCALCTISCPCNHSLTPHCSAHILQRHSFRAEALNCKVSHTRDPTQQTAVIQFTACIMCWGSNRQPAGASLLGLGLFKQTYTRAQHHCHHPHH